MGIPIFPAEQGFGSQLGQVLGQGLGQGLSQGLSQNLAKYHDEKKRSDLQKKLSQAYEKSGLPSSWALLPENVQTALIKEQGDLSQQNKKELAEQRKLQTTQEEKEKESQGLRETLDWLEKNKGYAGRTDIPFSKSFLGKGINRPAVEKRAEIDAAGFWAADQVFTHFNKGTVSKEKLKVIQQDLAPRSDISERAYKARISALRRIANLPKDTSKKKFDQILDHEVKRVKKDEGETSPPNSEAGSLDLSQFWK